MICVTVVRKDVLFLFNVLDTVVFMFMPVFMLLLLSSLMFCRLDGEIYGRDYVYFDVYNFVSGLFSLKWTQIKGQFQKK